MPDKTTRIKQEAMAVYYKLQSSDPEEVKEAMGEYLQLVDRFYEENLDLLTPEQYEAAKKDFEYFMWLMALTTQFNQ